MKSAGPTSTLRLIAEQAGVSTMTVSRALRHSPNVAAATQQRIQTIAESLGYRPDPQIARLMERVRSHRSGRIRSKLAIVRDALPEDELHTASYHYVSTEDIRARAASYGYDVEEFWLGRGKMTAQRLTTILHTRGIDGLLISPQSSRLLSGQMDYSEFAAATFGYGLSSARLHRSSTNMTQGIRSTLLTLEQRGYRRIGIAISPWIDLRSDHTYSGALLHYQQTVSPRRRVPLLLFEGNTIENEKPRFIQWVKREKPDVIIAFHRWVTQWLQQDMGLHIPHDIGMVVHDWVNTEPAMSSFAGIDHRRSHVAASGVDLVVTQLHHHERGIPEVPRQIQVPPQFMDGPSIRAACEI